MTERMGEKTKRERKDISEKENVNKHVWRE